MGAVLTNVKALNQSLQERLQKFLSPEEAGQQALWLLEALFGKKRMDLVLNSSLSVSEEEQQRLEEVLMRLEQHEPIQYVLGQAPFYGYMFHVNSAVLIPRPETEELVQLIVQEHEEKKELQLLDIGSGSGCIAISLALELKEAVVHAIDVSPQALAVARANARSLQARVQFVEADVLTDLPDLPPLDIIVSNPPYVRKQEALLMQKNVLSYEPHLALFVEDNEPLLFYRRIAFLASRMLKEGGSLYFEINEAFGKETAEMLEHFGFSSIRILKDMQGKDRMMTALWKNS